MKTQILLVSRTLPVRLGIRAMLEPEGDLEVAGIAGTEEELSAGSFEVDVIVLDWEAEFSEPIVGWAESRQLPLVLLGATREAVRLLKNGGIPNWCVLPKDAAPDEIAAACVAANAGLFASAFLDWVCPQPFEAVSDISSTVHLTSREAEILQMLGRGLSNKQIAHQLSISMNTIKFHVASILAKLGVVSRAEAVAEGIRAGLIPI